MAGTSSANRPLSPAMRRGHSQGPVSPGGSEVGSALSSKARPLRVNRFGSLHGAGLSSLQLALGEGTSTPPVGGFNAISTLLNDPRKPQRPIDPNSSRYPAVSQSHTDLPKVKRADVEGYMSATQKEWARFQRNLELGSQGKAKLAGDDGLAVAKGLDGNGGSSLEAAEVDNLSVIGKRKLPPLSTVPQVFFAEDFDLGNPYTFDLVTERYKAAGVSNNSRNASAIPGGSYDVALNQMLQEKLSYYSDVVEQHLILEISARSSSFFAALGNLQELEAEAARCLEKVKSLKAELEQKDEGIARAGLRVIREQAKRREYVERLEAVGILQMLCEKEDLCRLLVQNCEWSEALEVIDSLQDVIQGKTRLQSPTADGSSLPPHVDLDFDSIASVKAILPELDQLRGTISSQLESELLGVLARELEVQVGKPGDVQIPSSASHSTMARADLNGANGVVSPLEEKASPMSIPPEESATLPSYPAESELQARISPYLQGLIRTKGVDGAITSYREVALGAIKATLRVLLCESVQLQKDPQREDLAALLEDDEAASGKAEAKLSAGGAEAARCLQEISHVDFLALTSVVLAGLTKGLQSVEVQIRILLRILSDAGRNEAEESTISVVMPPGVSPSLPTILTTIVSDVGGLAHVLASRLLSLRSSIHINLSLGDFLAIFHSNWSFILQTETICRRMMIGLRGVVLNQAKSWLANFHKSRIEKAARAVEEERWDQAEASLEQQTFVELIVQSATADPYALLIGKEASTSKSIESAEKSTSKTVEIEGRPYFVVGATLDVLELLVEYLKVVINLPLLSTETMGRVVEFAKQFNSRTCQVVLGAGAMRSAGLKNITAKHLALASQSLSIMITLIPYVRETVRRHLSPKQAVMLIEFDKLKRDYQEHQYEIHSKLVAIMGDRLTVHCRALANIAWNEDGPNEAVQPAADLAKETATLHRVLNKFLQASAVESIIGQVFKAIDKRMSSELAKVEILGEAGIAKLNATKNLFDDKFAGLKHVEWSGKEMESTIEEQEDAFEKSKAAAESAAEAAASSAAEQETKEAAVPTYKPRLPLFNRKPAQAATPLPAAKSSLETDKAKIAENQNKPATVAKDPEESTEKPSMPTKNDKENPQELVEPVTVAAEQAPPTPSKEGERLVSPFVGAADSVDQKEGPVTSTPPTSPPATPTRALSETVTSPAPGRMTLQQRLAEAARKRAQSNSYRGEATIGARSDSPARTAEAVSGEKAAEIDEPAEETTAAPKDSQSEYKEAVHSGEGKIVEDILAPNAELGQATLQDPQKSEADHEDKAKAEEDTAISTVTPSQEINGEGQDSTQEAIADTAGVFTEKGGSVPAQSVSTEEKALQGSVALQENKENDEAAEDLYKHQQ